MYRFVRARLGVEPLEDRTTPAQFGNPWADPTHLTLSFAPDGSKILGLPSGLESALGKSMSPALWQRAVLRAVQTWSEAANLNIGVIADGGQAFGASGRTQGDPRFGDIRVGGVDMSRDALAAAVPPDPFIVGSLAGDLFINTRKSFTFRALYRVALHEVGHALGLGPSTDPASVMFNTFNKALVLSPTDVTAIRELYGARTPDANEGSNGNNSIDRATRVREPGSYDGFTPLVAYGEITTPGDVDVFEVRNQEDYRGPITFRLQTAGVSLLAARMIVTNQTGRVLAAATGSGMAGGVLSITLPQSVRGGEYFVRVLAVPGERAAVGRYALGVTFNGLVQPSAMPLAQVLRGPFDSLDEDDIEALFTNPDGSFYNDDQGLDDDPALPADLAPLPGFPEDTRYAATASLASAADADFYGVRSPQTESGTAVLTASVRAVGPNGTMPRIQLFRVIDEVTMALEPVAARILANGNGTFAVQAVGVGANADFVVHVGDAATPGNYELDVSFLTRAAEVKTFGSGTANAGETLTSTLFVARSQVFGFALTATGPVGATVQFSIVNAIGETVFSMTGRTGDTITATTPLIAPGEYTLAMSIIGPTGPVQFALEGGVLTDPIGPRPVNSSLAPQYTDPNQALTYVYPTSPDTTQTSDPYLFLPWFPI